MMEWVSVVIAALVAYNVGKDLADKRWEKRLHHEVARAEKANRERAAAVAELQRLRDAAP